MNCQQLNVEERSALAALRRLELWRPERNWDAPHSVPRPNAAREAK